MLPPCSQFDDETLKRMYRTMVTLNTMDQIFYDAQRQGRISFYMTAYGADSRMVVQSQFTVWLLDR